MINVLYVTPNFTIGGTEGQVFNLAVNLDKTKFRPFVISVGQDYGQRAQYADNGIETSVYTIFDIPGIVAMIRNNNIDVVHSFYYGNFSGWELVAAKLGGVKVFITSRRNMGYWRKRRHLAFDMFRNRFTDVVVANSYAVRERSIVDEKLMPQKIIVIYNGIDFSKYGGISDPLFRANAKKELGIDADCKVIGMVSNIKNIKGYEYFLNAARIIDNSGRKIKFIVAGEGSDQERFKDAASAQGLGSALISMGLCQDISKVMAAIDIFMYSSLSEGFPNIILEAMACGKAIVTTDVGGTGEMLLSDYCGKLVQPRDAESLAAATISLLDDPVSADRMGDAAKNIIEQFFSMKECIYQYEALYEHAYEIKR